MPSPLKTHTLPMMHRLNSEGMTTATLQGDDLRITNKSGTTVHYLHASEIKAVSLSKLPVANRLTVLTKDEAQISVNGLDKATSQALYTQLFTRVEELLNDDAKKALAIAPEIAETPSPPPSPQTGTSAAPTPRPWPRPPHACTNN